MDLGDLIHTWWTLYSVNRLTAVASGKSPLVVGNSEVRVSDPAKPRPVTHRLVILVYRDAVAMHLGGV